MTVQNGRSLKFYLELLYNVYIGDKMSVKMDFH